MKIDDGKWDLKAEEILSQVLKAGASDAEISISFDIAREVSLQNGSLEKAETAEAQHVSLRAYDGYKTATTSFSLNPNLDLSGIIDDLMTATRLTPEDPYCGLNAKEDIAAVAERDFDCFDDHPLLTIAELRARAEEMTRAVRSELRVDSATSSHGQRRTIYAASNGLKSDDWGSGASQSLVTIYEGKELVRDYASCSRVHLMDLESLAETAKRAEERTWNAREPKRASSGRYPIFFDQRISDSLIGHLLSVMSGSAIARKTSWLIDYEEPVFPKTWILKETPFRMRRLGSRVRDAEGFAKAENDLIKDGRPSFWIKNLSSARQLGEKSSGHAIGGISRGAGIGMAQVIGSTMSREKLLRDMGDGLLVTGFIGATINPHTGDYSRGVNGFMVRNGELAEAINETTIAGNLKDMLPSLLRADDEDEARDLVVGSLLVAEMTVAGA